MHHAAAAAASFPAATGAAFERGGGLRPFAFIRLRFISAQTVQISTMHPAIIKEKDGSWRKEK